MKKFWKWMEKKGYISIATAITKGLMKGYQINGDRKSNSCNTCCSPTKQMLIGYMIEYLYEKEIYDFPINPRGTEKIYNYLKQKIEELE